MKKLFFLLCFLLTPVLVYAQDAGYFVRADCGTLTGVANSSFCLQSTTASGRTAGIAYVWDGATWIASTGTSAGSGHQIEDEGSGVTQRAVMNFTGAGVDVADTGGKTVVTIPATAVVTFTDVGTGSNTSSTMTCGTGCSIAIAGSGTVAATSLTATSATLAAGITNETGSGLLVFGTSPTIVTPVIASFASATHTHTNAGGGGQLTDAALSAAVTVPKGGTGVATLTNHGVLLGQAASAIVATGAGTTGQVLTSNGASADPTFEDPISATEVDTQETVFGRGKQITTGANSFANRWGAGHGGAGCGTYVDGTTGPQFVCWPASGVQNDLDKFIKLEAGKVFNFQNSAGTAKGTFTETTGAFTNVTLDAEATGNNIGTVSYITIYAANCVATVASLGGDDDAQGATAPTAACNDFGTTQVPTASFSGSAVNTRQFRVTLPPDWNSSASVGIKLRYYTLANSPSGNTEWDISTLCRAPGEAATAAYNAIQTITDAVVAQTTNRWANDADQGALTMTGCAADEDLFILVSRDGTNDTNNDAAGLAWLRLAIRRTQ